MTYISRSGDFSSFIFCSEKHFSFIGKAQLRRATLSCDSSYLKGPFFISCFIVHQEYAFYHEPDHQSHILFPFFSHCSDNQLCISQQSKYLVYVTNVTFHEMLQNLNKFEN